MPNANQPDETVRLLLGSVDARIDSVGEDILLVEPRGLPEPEGYPVKTNRMVISFYFPQKLPKTHRIG